MADEITVIAQINIQNLTLIRQFVGSGSDDQAAAFAAQFTRALTGAVEAITDTGVPNIGWVGILNLSTTGNVIWGESAINTPHIVPPLTASVFNRGGGTLFAGASAGTVNADFFLAEQ